MGLGHAKLFQVFQGTLGGFLVDLGNSQHGLQGANQCIQLRHACPDLGDAGLDFCETSVNLHQIGIQLCLLGVQLRLLGGELGAGTGQSTLTAGLGGFEKLLGLLQLFLVGLQLFPAIGDFLLRFLQLCLSIGKLLFSIQQLPAGILQLLKGIGLLPLIIQNALVVFLLPIQNGLLRLLPGGNQALLGIGLQQRLQFLCRLGQGIIVFLGIDGVVPGEHSMNLRVIADVEGFLGDKIVVGDAAAAHGGVAPVGVHIQGGTHQSHHGEGVHRQLVQGGILIIRGDGDGFAQNGFGISESIGQALPRSLRHPSFQQHQLVDALRDGVEPIDRRVLSLVVLHNQVGVKQALGILQPAQLRDRRQLILIPTIGAEQAQVKHILFIGVDLSRGHHVHLCRTQTHKDSSAQGDNHRNGNVAPQGFENRAAQIPAHHIPLHYHSISAISRG